MKSRFLDEKINKSTCIKENFSSNHLRKLNTPILTLHYSKTIFNVLNEIRYLLLMVFRFVSFHNSIQDFQVTGLIHKSAANAK